MIPKDQKINAYAALDFVCQMLAEGMNPDSEKIVIGEDWDKIHQVRDGLEKFLSEEEREVARVLRNEFYQCPSYQIGVQL